MHLEIVVHGLERRTLWTDPSRRWGSSLLMSEKASVKELSYKVDLAQIQLITESRKLALKPAVELFQHFGWNPSLDILRNIQDELLHKRSLVTGQN